MYNLGVTEKTILNLAYSHMETVKRCYWDNNAAFTLLHSFNKIYYKINMIVNSLLGSNMTVSEEPMLKSIFNYLLIKNLMGIKYRHRIHMNHGTVMKGVLDEYNLLKYDEVFVHINLQRNEADILRQRYSKNNQTYKQN